MLTMMVLSFSGVACNPSTCSWRESYPAWLLKTIALGSSSLMTHR